jgi:GNAT superfamily N-acetyltransferase
MTNLKIIPLQKEHLPAAAALLVARYQEGRKLNPLWPDKYRKAEEVLPFFGYHQEEQISVAAQRGGKTVGFMVSFPWDNFGVPVVWIPDWAHAAVAEERGYIYRLMYAEVARQRVAEGRLKHCAAVYAGEREVLDAFYALGFGMHGMDSIRGIDSMRGLEPVKGSAAEITIRQAGLRDLDSLMELRRRLSNHLRQAPTYAYFPDTSVEAGAADFEKQLKDENAAVFLACRRNEIIGVMRVIPSMQSEFKLPVFDEGTCSINMAFVSEDCRGTGIAPALLNAILDWGREKGYKRCGVDYESANLPGARFWLKNFKPVCYGLTRFIDKRVYDQIKDKT